MLKKTVKFTDFNGEEAEETLYFNLSGPEQVRFAAQFEEGLEAHINRISSNPAKYFKEIVEFFELLFDQSYGVKSTDGRTFKKSEELVTEFRQSAAYEALYMELMQNSKAAADFFNAVIVPNPLATKATSN